MPELTSEPTSTPTPRPTATPRPTPTPAPSFDEYLEIYAPILDAYEALERSGYIQINYQLIGNSLLATQKDGTYNFGWTELPRIVYTLIDLNNNGSPELCIGADLSFTSYDGTTFYEIYHLSGIYTINYGQPVSLIQVRDRQYLSISTDINGNTIISTSGGHMGYYYDEFFALVEAEHGDMEYLLWMDEYITEEDYFHYKAPYYDAPREEFTQVSQAELDSAMRFYGVSVFNSDGENEARLINLDWNYVLR